MQGDDLVPHPSEAGQASAKDGGNEDISNDGLPAEVVEAMEHLPPEARQVLKMGFMATSFSRSPSSALAKSVTPEHITQTLQNNDKERERTFKLNQAGEWTKRMGIGAILFLAVLVLLYAAITGDKETADKVIIAGISGIGGYGAGVAMTKRD